MKTMFDAYYKWWDMQACSEYSAPNHAIVTMYKDGSDYIGQHQDKTADLDRDTLISVVKLGEDARPFEIVEKEYNRVLFRDLLRPGDAVIMSRSAARRSRTAFLRCKASSRTSRGRSSFAPCGRPNIGRVGRETSPRSAAREDGGGEARVPRSARREKEAYVTNKIFTFSLTTRNPPEIH